MVLVDCTLNSNESITKLKTVKWSIFVQLRINEMLRFKGNNALCMHLMQKCSCILADTDTNAMWLTCSMQRWMLLFFIIFPFFRHQRHSSQYRTLFCCLPISCSPWSNMFSDWILVVTSQTVGAWLPLALSDRHWLPSTRHHLSCLTTLNRAPCYAPYEALAPPFHNEAVKKRGAD